VPAVETLKLEASWKFEQGIVRHPVISHQVVCRFPQSLHGDIEALLVDDRRDVIAERQSMTSFLLEAAHQEVHKLLTRLTHLVLVETENPETDACGTLILQSPLTLEPGVFDLSSRLLHIEGLVGKWNEMGGGREGGRKMSDSWVAWCLYHRDNWAPK
jgi:hypothetical protein